MTYTCELKHLETKTESPIKTEPNLKLDFYYRGRPSLSRYLKLPSFFVEHEHFIMNNGISRINPTELIVQLKFSNTVIPKDEKFSHFYAAQRNLSLLIGKNDPAKLLVLVALMHLWLETIHGRHILREDNEMWKTIESELYTLHARTGNSTCPFDQYLWESSLLWIYKLSTIY